MQPRCELVPKRFFRAQSDGPHRDLGILSRANELGSTGAKFQQRTGGARLKMGTLLLGAEDAGFRPLPPAGRHSGGPEKEDPARLVQWCKNMQAKLYFLTDRYRGGEMQQREVVFAYILRRLHPPNRINSTWPRAVPNNPTQAARTSPPIRWQAGALRSLNSREPLPRHSKPQSRLPRLRRSDDFAPAHAPSKSPPATGNAMHPNTSVGLMPRAAASRALINISTPRAVTGWCPPLLKPAAPAAGRPFEGAQPLCRQATA